MHLLLGCRWRLFNGPLSARAFFCPELIVLCFASTNHAQFFYVVAFLEVLNANTGSMCIKINQKVHF